MNVAVIGIGRIGLPLSASIAAADSPSVGIGCVAITFVTAT